MAKMRTIEAAIEVLKLNGITDTFGVPGAAGTDMTTTQQTLDLINTTGRHEPGVGKINYPFLFNYLDEIGYKGWIGYKYKPATTTNDGLGWIKPYQN